MQIFYSARENAFFNDLFHGTRTLPTLDPSWLQPMVTIDDPDWVRPVVEVDDPSWVEDEGGLAKKILVPDVEAVCPKVDVPDAHAVQPYVAMPNPNCLLPPEAELVEVTELEHSEIFDKLATGKFILAAGVDKHPTTIAAPGPSKEQLEYVESVFCQNTLLQTDSIVSRHRDEVEFEETTTLTTAQYKALQLYRQALRGWSDSKDFPDSTKRPAAPTWL